MRNDRIDFAFLAFFLVCSVALFACSCIAIVNNFGSDPLSREGVVVFGLIGTAMFAAYMFAEALRGLQKHL